MHGENEASRAWFSWGGGGVGLGDPEELGQLGQQDPKERDLEAAVWGGVAREPQKGRVEGVGSPWSGGGTGRRRGKS